MFGGVADSLLWIEFWRKSTVWIKQKIVFFSWFLFLKLWLCYSHHINFCLPFLVSYSFPFPFFPCFPHNRNGPFELLSNHYDHCNPLIHFISYKIFPSLMLSHVLCLCLCSLCSFLLWPLCVPSVLCLLQEIFDF